MKASTLAGSEFLGRLAYYGRSWLPARDLVVESLSKRFRIHPSGHIVKFDKFAPWKVRRAFNPCQEELSELIRHRNTYLKLKLIKVSPRQTTQFT